MSLSLSWLDFFPRHFLLTRDSYTPSVQTCTTIKVFIFDTMPSAGPCNFLNLLSILLQFYRGCCIDCRIALAPGESKDAKRGISASAGHPVSICWLSNTSSKLVFTHAESKHVYTRSRVFQTSADEAACDESALI